MHLDRLEVGQETGVKRTFVWAIDWPGWARAGRDPGLALEALVASAPRYAARRIAWHALDHAWEVEDRTEPATEDRAEPRT